MASYQGIPGMEAQAYATAAAPEARSETALCFNADSAFSIYDGA